MVEALDIKKFVNEILGKKGVPAVKNFAKEFADGSTNIFIRFMIKYSSFPTTLQHPL